MVAMVDSEVVVFAGREPEKIGEPIEPTDVERMEWAPLADVPGLIDSGARAEHLASGCCGLAGNFAFQPGHAHVSQVLAGQVLLLRLRDADPATVILADGFSCRTQIHELDSGGREAMHLAELLDAVQRGDLPASLPEEHAAPRPIPPSQAARLAATAGVLAGTAATVAVAVARAVEHPIAPCADVGGVVMAYGVVVG